MEKLEELIKQYLVSANVMQLATSIDGQPWVCTVHFYADDDFNLYWISTEARRHSREIRKNKRVAAAILVHENTMAENYIIGISIEGVAECIGLDVDEQIAQNYVKKLHKPPNLLPAIMNGKNPHKFYRLVPSRIVLCDTKKFPDNPWQEWNSN